MDTTEKELENTIFGYIGDVNDYNQIDSAEYNKTQALFSSNIGVFLLSNQPQEGLRIACFRYSLRAK